MISLVKTSPKSIDFETFVKALDADLAIRDGDDHAFYHQFNQINNLKYIIVLYHADLAVACGAIKEYDKSTMEIKRMYTLPAHRGKGYASQIISALEDWTLKLGYSRCILETGINQPEAIALYKKNEFQIINNYGQYEGLETSFCFEKVLK
ncbi:MAG: GNAT family N-acetyltransferase [Putridiphycobacter sp.]|nr:GNAT family N-acetyltransferase [Putridiphycobacter sp.]